VCRELCLRALPAEPARRVPPARLYLPAVPRPCRAARHAPHGCLPGRTPGKGKPGKPQPQRRTKTGRLRPEDAKKAELVDCPRLGRAGHGADCALCHGKGKIPAIK